MIGPGVADAASVGSDAGSIGSDAAASVGSDAGSIRHATSCKRCFLQLRGKDGRTE